MCFIILMEIPVVWRSARRDCDCSQDNAEKFPWPASQMDWGTGRDVLCLCVCVCHRVLRCDLKFEVLQSLLELKLLILVVLGICIHFALSCWPANASVRAVCYSDKIMRDLCEQAAVVWRIKTLQCCFLAVFCNCRSKTHLSTGFRPAHLFICIIQKVTMCL